MPSAPFNLQQRWPEAERAWLRQKAEDLTVTETVLLLALVRREADSEPRSLEEYFPPAPPRSKRRRAERQARKAER